MAADGVETNWPIVGTRHHLSLAHSRVRLVGHFICLVNQTQQRISHHGGQANVRERERGHLSLPVVLVVMVSRSVMHTQTNLYQISKEASTVFALYHFHWLTKVSFRH